MKFAHRRDGMTPEEVPDRIEAANKVLGAPKVMLVMADQLSSDNLRRLAERGLLCSP